MNRPRLQIVRGLPGSGKSTYARRHWPHLLMLELDQFCQRGGHYHWSPEVNDLGKEWLKAQIDSAIGYGFDLVVCGVFAGNDQRLYDIVHYALEHLYDVWIETLTGDYGNRHGVRQADYDEMKRTFPSDGDLAASLDCAFRFGSMPDDMIVDPVKEE